VYGFATNFAQISHGVPDVITCGIFGDGLRGVDSVESRILPLLISPVAVNTGQGWRHTAHSVIAGRYPVCKVKSPEHPSSEVTDFR